jgi:glycosyltransferase involved in cell wall biosynthesis
MQTLEETSVSIIIPAYNEENAVRQQVEAIRKVMLSNGIAHEIIVVDDCSLDNTAEQAAKADAKVLRHPKNKGYGGALKTGISAAEHEIIIITDADGTYPAEAIPDMLEKSQEYDMVVGARIGLNVHVPFSRRPAKWFLRKLASYLAGEKIPDLNSGLRIMKKSIVEQYYHILPTGFSFTTTITLACLCNDYLVYYYPIEYNKRVGKSKIRPVDAYYFLLLILRTIVYFNPLKVFLPTGAVFFCFGLGKFIYDIYLNNLSESAIFGFLGALIIWAIGLLSDQISKTGLHMWSK